MILLLKERYQAGREEAIEALGKIGDTRALVPLIRALKDENTRVKKKANWAVGNMADKNGLLGITKILGKLDMIAPIELESNLPKVDDISAIERLSKALDENNSKSQEKAIWGLSRLGDTRASDIIVKKLNEPSLLCQKEAITALGDVGKANSIPVLLKFLNHEDIILSDSARIALRKLHERWGITPFIDAMKSENDFIRSKALEFIKTSQSDELINHLIEILKEEDVPEIRAKAAWALGWSKNSKATEPLIQALKREKMKEVKSEIAWALGWIKNPYKYS